MMKSILSFFLITGILYSAELSRDSNGIVSDSSTNLQWQDNITRVYINWSEAINYCEGLDLGGKDDWRLPNHNELLSLVDYTKYNPVVKESVFQNFIRNENPDLTYVHDYWSSTGNAVHTSHATFIGSVSGNMSSDFKTNSRYVLCVRDRQ